MASYLKIRTINRADVPLMTSWARQEGFAPGKGDVGIYRHTDRQGLWVGCLGGEPIGCIAGVRYNLVYGFIGLYIVRPDHRGQGYGKELWQHALDHLESVACIGLEAAEDRIDDYSRWGFQPASPTIRWRTTAAPTLGSSPDLPMPDGLRLLSGDAIPEPALQIYDAQRELSPRPHFLSDWLHHPAGSVVALLDQHQACHGFARIRPCLLIDGEGWRIGPLLADSPELAELLIRALLQDHPGVVIIDSPGGNPFASPLMERIGFEPFARTLRMYRGRIPNQGLEDVYGLACLELG
ncbi:GNAT family N-acetyltransferase [Synechococcus sp. UW105]|uniref:GNAT family N-acetyltransferase n=1 Tax=unclassified Synechococcus TaxID=2626047 RepID=UPI000C8CD29F|nr:GNAT family N-acetyltransferase [Synechococcus sp. UW105]MAS28485.1 GNAT family N-acetyltransferase [Synechococcus sp. NAT40]